MTPRTLQALALMQNAIGNMNTANGLLLQELADALESAENSEPENPEGDE